MKESNMVVYNQIIDEYCKQQQLDLEWKRRKISERIGWLEEAGLDGLVSLLNKCCVMCGSFTKVGDCLNVHITCFTHNELREIRTCVTSGIWNKTYKNADTGNPRVCYSCMKEGKWFVQIECYTLPESCKLVAYEVPVAAHMETRFKVQCGPDTPIEDVPPGAEVKDVT